VTGPPYHGGIRRLLLTLRSSPTLRTLFSLLFAASTAQSLPVSLIALFAKDSLGASNLAVSVYYAATALASLTAVLISGRRVKAGRERRLVIQVCLGWLVVGYLAIAMAQEYWQILLTGIVFMPAGGVLIAQTMALTREASGATSEQPIVITASSRTIFSLGYVSGAPLGSFLAAGIGPRHVMQLSACVMTGCLVIAICGLRSLPAELVSHAEAAAGPPARSRNSACDDTGRPYRLLVAFCAVCVLLSSGRIMQLAMLPIVMRDQLHAPASTIGAALAIPPLLELVLMPLAAVAALRVGRGTVYLAGAAALTAYYAVLTFAVAPWQIFLNQALYAVYGSAGIMLGIDIAQNLLPSRIGVATSAYLGHENLASVLGGVLTVAAAAMFEPQEEFSLPFMMCVAALGWALILFVRNRRKFDLRDQQLHYQSDSRSSNGR
jgi:SET family sugar efflux transporter-like MFS transporter